MRPCAARLPPPAAIDLSENALNKAALGEIVACFAGGGEDKAEGVGWKEKREELDGSSKLRSCLPLTILTFFAIGLAIHMVTLTPGLEHSIKLPSFFASWLLVALGYNMMSTVTLSLLSKQVPPHFNSYTSLIIQLSNYSGRL
ncbi:unnamed protein product [Tilletia controversa]|uniref:Uncharacterized protein n=3 Tax=Tilletia TaxID=13289 RepID=A0A8X7MR89_9BASI|nr:hypothetical protein CF335_g4014 [Tilletia laevis]KAE8203753.1 hypothetical protein CF328_g1474 [Tilletia controversa]KAE8265051.1 hypothetical protein A4X03_0g521 [Tilletia caries]KAE8200201.1 hypothetical protein CF336_g818 [Tilletia laevis]KAE8246195.1 hypothetical protein A4X06_0g5121 [Tilletia controversa]